MQRALDGVWNRRVATLPAEGVLLVSTDLHGNLGDYRRMVELYDAEVEAGNAPILAFCGDLVHGPSPDVLERWPDHLGTAYYDDSAELIVAFERFTRENRAFSLIGNHEHAHVGGPVVPKFYPDEAAVLETALGGHRDAIRDFIGSFPLLAVAPCGIVLTHGAPAATLPSLSAFELLDYAGYEDFPFHVMRTYDALGALLWARACAPSDALDLLEVAFGERSGVVAFGHDIVREGFVVESPHHICVSTSFGLYDGAKTYLRLDLAGRYRSADDLRPGVEILPLHPR